MIPDRPDAILRRDEIVLPTEGGIAAARQAAVEALAQGSKIRLAYALGKQWVRVDVEDNGCGFGETQHIGVDNLQEAGARGLSLIQAFTSRMQYEGNIISMELDLHANPASSLEQIATILDPERGLLC